MKIRLFTMILAVLLIVCLLPTSALAAESSVQVLVEPTMDYTVVYEFSEGLAIAQKGGLRGQSDAGMWGFIDKTGNVVVPLIYDDVWYFAEGLAPVSKDGKWGYIDKTGNVVIPLVYDYAWTFSEGLAAVKKNGKYGFINRMGEIVIPFLYTTAFKFSEGLAYVTNNDSEENRIGYIDKTGKTAISLHDIPGSDFSEGLATVATFIGKDLKYGFINKTGELVIPFQYDYAAKFSEGFASVEKNGKYGFIDKTGKVVIPLEYQWAWDYSEGLAPVGGPDGRKYIDKTGKDAFQHTYGLVGLFTDGIARVGTTRLDEDGFLIDTGWWNLIDKTGKLLLPLDNKYTRMWYAEGLAVVEQDDKWGILQIAVKPTEWAQADVARAISLNLVPDILQFKYTQATTRAEFCALAVAFYEEYTGAEITGRVKFDDTSDVNVEKISAVGVVNGVGNNKFAPDDTLTREQAAVMIARLAEVIGNPLEKKDATFNDNNSISSWAIEGVGQVQATGIMGGVGNNTFAPKDPYTREQSIITMIRVWNIVKP